MVKNRRRFRRWNVDVSVDYKEIGVKGRGLPSEEISKDRRRGTGKVNGKEGQ